MAFDPMQPYGEVLDTTVRIASWNVWSRFGPWQQREPILIDALTRLDHIFSHWPKRGGAGHPVAAAIIGDEPVDGVFASDHFGVMADLRY